ncbi:MAG TPA: hypothetical protein VIU41_09145 [Geobacteraceae bacterium]
MINPYLTKICSLLLIVVMLAFSVTGACASAHAIEGQLMAADDHACCAAGISAPQDCPSCPLDDEHGADGCSNCFNCLCHASLLSRPFQLAYQPFILLASCGEPFTALPEVYLPKFIPPQNLA